MGNIINNGCTKYGCTAITFLEDSIGNIYSVII